MLCCIELYILTERDTCFFFWRAYGCKVNVIAVCLLPKGPKVVPFGGSYLEYYKVIPKRTKRNYFGAFGKSRRIFGPSLQGLGLSLQLFMRTGSELFQPLPLKTLSSGPSTETNDPAKDQLTASCLAIKYRVQVRLQLLYK